MDKKLKKLYLLHSSLMHRGYKDCQEKIEHKLEELEGEI